MTISAMQSEVDEASRAIDMPEDKALKAASASPTRDDDVSALKSDMAVVRWMLGFMLAMQVAIRFRLFAH